MQALKNFVFAILCTFTFAAVVVAGAKVLDRPHFHVNEHGVCEKMMVIQDGTEVEEICPPDWKNIRGERTHVLSQEAQRQLAHELLLERILADEIDIE